MLRENFFRHLAQTSEEPPCLEISRGEGVCLYDVWGKKYIDFISGISVSNTGHAHPEIIEAVNRQMKSFSHVMVYGEHVLEPQVSLAGKLCELCGDAADNVYFVNSGTEAVEGAIKLAKRYTGRYNVVSFRNAYHGGSHLCLSLMSPNPLNMPFRPLVPGIIHCGFNEMSAVDSIDEKTACVIIEPVQGEAGAVPAEKQFLEKVREKCNKTGTLLIFDEVQTGMGRTGSWFAYQQYNVVPDILVLAKALGGGMPLGAFLAPKSIMQVLSHDPPLGHITTFGGHPVSCAASLAAINIVEKGNYIKDVSRKEKLFRDILVHPKIKDITGKGLLLAVHLENEKQVKKVMAGCIKKGVITDWFLFKDSAIRVAPPLIIDDETIKNGCNIILEVLDQA